ncbi:MAG: hypothetical protein JXQ23_03785 [Clostridia bacterium]|nr:hypothetical protein [Clostridia bacterium]
MSQTDQIVFNPLTEKYELPILNPNYEQAFRYILDLIEKQYVCFTSNSMDNSIMNSISYSGYQNNTLLNAELGETDIGFYLDGANKSHLIFTRNHVNGFMILKDSKNIEEKISFIFDRLFKDENLRNAFSYGYEGYNYITESDGIHLQTKEDGSLKQAPRIYFRFIQPTIPVIFSATDNVITSATSSKANTKMMEVKENYTDEMFYYYNHAIGEVSSGSFTSELVSCYSDFYNSVFHDHTDITEAIEKYREQIEATGVLEYLDEINN